MGATEWLPQYANRPPDVPACKWLIGEKCRITVFELWNSKFEYCSASQSRHWGISWFAENSCWLMLVANLHRANQQSQHAPPASCDVSPTIRAEMMIERHLRMIIAANWRSGENVLLDSRISSALGSGHSTAANTVASHSHTVIHWHSHTVTHVEWSGVSHGSCQSVTEQRGQRSVASCVISRPPRRILAGVN